MRRRSLLWSVLVLAGLAWSCSEDPAPVKQHSKEVPLGSWVMYGGQKGMIKASALDQEETILVLADSTYSLTFQRPDAKFVYVESGKVYYDIRAKMARFTVASISAIDWSMGEPRKLVIVPETVPFQRDPGTTYGMEFTVTDSLMSLAGSGQETSWFVRQPQ
jgi:hypothetical protein